MSERMNVNVLLCENCDESIQNLQNIFNAVTLDFDKKVSFYVVTILNGINLAYDKMKFLYYIQKVDPEKPKRRFLYSMTVTRRESTEDDNREPRHSMEKNVLYESTKYYAKDIIFPEAGEYEVAVFMYKDEEIQDLEKLNIKEMANSEKLIAIKGFVVKD